MSLERLAPLLVTAVVLLLGACSTAPEYRYRPYSVRTDPEPIVETALIFYEGDMDALRAAGARYIGTLEVAGSHGSDTPEARLRAELEAAEAGGTHIIATSIAAAHRVTSWTNGADGGGEAPAQRSPDPAQPRAPAPTRGAAFYVVRVPKAAFAELPKQLNPEPMPGSSCGIAEIHEALLDGPDCLQDLEPATVEVVIDADGRVSEMQGVDGSARRCLAHLFGPIRVQPAPGHEVRCQVRAPVAR